jgi:5-methylcytosine-specific restriction endonuclease McrA
MILKSCNRCGSLIQYGATYCDICRPIVEAEREARKAEANKRANRRYNQARDPKYIRFYNSSEWRILSRKRLQDDGYKCVKCKKIASEVDHIEAIQTPGGWSRRLDYSNLQSLCIECHNAKHDRFKKRNALKGV